MTTNECVYCDFDDYDVLVKNDFGVVFPEPKPLSNGHMVIVPLRHIHSFFEVTDKERKSLLSLLEQTRNALEERYQPTGYHIGFNDGNVFGDTVEHLHIHVIPRYKNQHLKLDARWGILDVEDTP